MKALIDFVRMTLEKKILFVIVFNISVSLIQWKSLNCTWDIFKIAQQFIPQEKNIMLVEIKTAIVFQCYFINTFII